MRLALHWRALEGGLGPDAPHGPSGDSVLDTFLGAAAAGGFSGVEARREDLLALGRRGGSRLARLFAQHGVCQAATDLGADLDAPPAEFEAACVAGERLAALLRGLTNFGVGQPVLCVGAPAGEPPAGEAEPGPALRLERLRLLADLAASVGFTLLLDPAPGAATEPGDAALARLRGWIAAAARRNLGLVFDCFLWAEPRAEPRAEQRAEPRAEQRAEPRAEQRAEPPGSLPHHAQADGPPSPVPGLRGLPLHCRLADRTVPGGAARLGPGRGGLDLAEALRRLRGIDYAGYVSVDAPLGRGDAFAAARRCQREAEGLLRAALGF